MAYVLPETLVEQSQFETFHIGGEFNEDYYNYTWVTAFNRAFLPINKDDPLTFPRGNVNDIEFPYAHDYAWMYYASIVFGFITAYGIGANDVANAFATSVGAKAITVTQAVIIAAIFEFAGAVGLGSSVTKTVRKGIVDTELFEGHEDWLALGMLCTVIIVGFWLFTATAFELPVSTTHSTIGGIIGFALATPNGAAAVAWNSVALVVASWFASPALSGIFAALIYYFCRTFILRSANSFSRTLKFFPVLVGLTVFMNAAYVIFKGIKNKVKLDEGPGFGISAGIGLFAALCVQFVIVPIMKRRLGDIPDEPARDADQIANIEDKKDDDLEEEKTGGGFISGITNQANVHKAIEDDERVSSIHENAERFSLRTERAFSYLQVFTAIFDSFSHGANDVANSIGPLAAVYNVYTYGPRLNEKFINDKGQEIGGGKTEVPIFILAIGGLGIVVGLATYGYKIMAAIGVKMVKVTPSRGFAIELGAAFVIVTGSFLSLPLSTTHCQVGATIGVGLLEGNAKEAVNWPLLARVFGGWVFTLVVAGSGCALLFSFAVYAPSINAPVSVENCLYSSAVTMTAPVESPEFASFEQGVVVPTFPVTLNGTLLNGEASSGLYGNAVTLLAGNPVTGEYLVGDDTCLNGKECTLENEWNVKFEHLQWEAPKDD